MNYQNFCFGFPFTTTLENLNGVLLKQSEGRSFVFIAVNYIRVTKANVFQ